MAEYRNTDEIWEKLQEAYEPVRKKAKIVDGLLVSGVVLVVLAVVNRKNPALRGSLLFMSMVVLISCFVFKEKVYTPRKKELHGMFKDSIVKDIFKEKIDNFMYSPSEGIGRSEMNNIGLISLGTDYHSEDLMSGSYRNVHFRRADVLVEQESGNSETSTRSTIFRGAWYTFDSPISYANEVVVIEKGFKVGRKKTSIFTSSESRRHKTEMNNDEFDSRFRTYALNEADSYQILTPLMMENLLRFAADARGAMLIGFQSNKIHVAIDSRYNYFEPNMKNREAFNRSVEAVENELNTIIRLINTLGLAQ
ncbi:MAG: DUF3137 domain-containing protein [Eubacteriales bacterium]|nr:DUF3137 domain-containing protein [Eubacteriales bacterium]